MHRSLALASVALVAIASPALAQDAPPVEDRGDIVVTAQLREQDPIDVPIAVTAVTDEQLKRLGITELEQASRFIPGFFVQNQSPNNPGFVVRGITSDSGTAYNEPRVSVYQDGVSIAKSRGSYVELFDIERLEVAKGPQSTLYGRGALIGAVNVVQNKANPDHFEAYGRAQYGNFDSWLGEAMVNLPTGDGGALRLAGRYRERDGFIDNLLGGRDFNSVRTWALRGSAHQEFGDLDLDVIGNYQKDTPAGTSFKSIAYNPTDPVTGAQIGDRSPNSGAALAPGAGFEGGRPLGLRREVGGVTGIANWRFTDQVRLTAITAYREFDTLEVFDADGIALPMLTAAEDTHSNQFSQELRLTFESDRVTAFVGGSYFYEDGYQRTPAQYDERAVLARFAGALAQPGTANPLPLAALGDTRITSQLIAGVAAARGVTLSPAQALGIASNLRSDFVDTSTNFATTKAFDLFGDVTFRLTDRLELTGGVRYTHDDKRTAFSSATVGRSILGGLIGATTRNPDTGEFVLDPVTQATLLGALAIPGAGTSIALPIPPFGLGAQPTVGNGGTESQDFDNGGFSWRAVARFEVSPQASLYASYARGRRSAVLAAEAPGQPLGPVVFTRLPQETVDSFEVGAKTALMDRRLFVDASVFYYDYSNFQTTEQVGTRFVQVNAGKAESYGVEAQARWVPTDDVSLFATYAYNHSRFKAGRRDGNRFRLTPDNAASFGAIVGVPLGDDAGRITLTPSVTWQSRIYFDDDNDIPALQQPPRGLVADNIRDETQGSYALVNGRIGYESPQGWQIEGFIENAFDKKYINDAGNTGDSLGMPTFIAGNPRFYGVAATVRFGAGR